MRFLENKWFWAVAFGLLFALSIDLWAWGRTDPIVFGLPYIVLYTMLLEAALFVLFLLFIKFYWKDSEEVA